MPKPDLTPAEVVPQQTPTAINRINVNLVIQRQPDDSYDWNGSAVVQVEDENGNLMEEERRDVGDLKEKLGAAPAAGDIVTALTSLFQLARNRILGA